MTVKLGAAARASQPAASGFPLGVVMLGLPSDALRAGKQSGTGWHPGVSDKLDGIAVARCWRWGTPAGTGVAGLESDGDERFFCGGNSSKGRPARAGPGGTNLTAELRQAMLFGSFPSDPGRQR